MNAETSARWFELAFVHEGARVIAAFRSRRDAQTALDGEVRATEKQMRQALQDVCRVEIMPLAWAGTPGTAAEAVTLLLENTRSSLEDLSEEDSEERQDWQHLKALADAVDTYATPDATAELTHRIDFVWNNGGMDDNLCSMDFAVGPQGSEAVGAFAAAFEAMGAKYDLFYDCGIHLKGASPLETRICLSDVPITAPRALVAFPSLRSLLEKAAALEQEAELSETLMRDTPRSARSRM